jgi:hypothetical protein
MQTWEPCERVAPLLKKNSVVEGERRLACHSAGRQGTVGPKFKRRAEIPRLTLATEDPVDGTLYAVYQYCLAYTCRRESKRRLLEGWRMAEGGAQRRVSAGPSE